MTNIEVLEERVANLVKANLELAEENSALEIRLRTLEISHGRLSERVSLFQLGQAIFASVTASIATILGISFG